MTTHSERRWWIDAQTKRLGRMARSQIVFEQRRNQRKIHWRRYSSLRRRTRICATGRINRSKWRDSCAIDLSAKKKMISVVINVFRCISALLIEWIGTLRNKWSQMRKQNRFSSIWLFERLETRKNLSLFLHICLFSKSIFQNPRSRTIQFFFVKSPNYSIHFLSLKI